MKLFKRTKVAAPTPALITIVTVNQLFEAHMIESILNNEEIAVFLQDINTAQTYVNAIGGIKIQVPNHDAEKAYNILKEAGYI